MTNSIKQGLKDGNGGNMVTGTKITVFSGTAKLPFDEIKSAYYQAKATKLQAIFCEFFMFLYKFFSF